MSWRLVVTGSECTGKTTLALEIARRLGAPCIAEPSRAYAEARGGVLTAADVEPIALATIAALQAVQREQAQANAQGEGAQNDVQGAEAQAIVFDTDLVSTMVYARAYYGSCPAWIEAASREQPGDLYLLCAPDLPWVADGVRDQPAATARAAMHDAFVLALQDLGARVAHITGTGDIRTERAMAAVRAAKPPMDSSL
jgi:nicotinamide riboside kinase